MVDHEKSAHHRSESALDLLIHQGQRPAGPGAVIQPASKAALPPAAVVLTVMVCSAQKRYR